MSTTDTAFDTLTPGYANDHTIGDRSLLLEILQHGKFFDLEFVGQLVGKGYKVRARRRPEATTFVKQGTTVAQAHEVLERLQARAAAPGPVRPELVRAAPITKALESALWSLYGPVGQDARVHRNDVRAFAAYRQLEELGLVRLRTTDVPDVWSVERQQWQLKRD